MIPAGVRDCVVDRHRAQEERGGDAEELRARADDLIRVLETRRDLSRLATTPLLCAVVCALHRNSDGVLSEGRNALYRAALTMIGRGSGTERQHPSARDRRIATT